eukprot:Opistho-2@35890
MASKSQQKVLVIGGGGFLGRHIVELLLERNYAVNVFDMRETFKDANIKFFVGDLLNKNDVMPALQGVDFVIHCASPSPLSDNRALFYKVNVDGTKNLMDWCKESNVHRLVLTSSASVVFEGVDVKNGDEALPYASRPIDAYTETKILQEELVLKASDDGKFMTVAVRPHGIFGPRDPHLVPTLVETARAGKTKFMIGDGENLVDFTHVRNVAHAHIVAGESLKKGAKINGKAYNITNDEPIRFWDFLGRILTGLGYPAPQSNLPYRFVYVIAVILQFFCFILRPITVIKPTFTPMKVALAGTYHYYDCSAAKRDFGYKPIVKLSDGIADTLEHFRHLRNEN